MHYLSEDPWPLFGTLSLVAVGFLIALKVTGDGRNLIRAGIAFGLALAFLGIERLWVTDNERIEAVVYDMARAFQEKKPDEFAKHLDPELDRIGRRDMPISVALALIRDVMMQSDLDLVRVYDMEAKAGQQSRRGTARFKVQIHGSTTYMTGGATINLSPPVHDSEWSFGFREAERHVWKVTEINALHLPLGAPNVL